jgi:hypothetical protein
VAGDIRDLSLLALDQLETANLVLFCALDERPLKGAAGLVDWRTNGWLSRLIVTGQFRCQRGERLLTLSQGRLRAQRLFLFGLGESRALTASALGEIATEATKTLREAEVREAVLGFPGAGEADTHRALLDSLMKKMGDAKVTTFGPWRKMV